MRKTLLALAALALALAGCSDDGGGHEAEPVACPDGTMVTPEQVEASEHHHHEGFNATDLCPVAPSVRLEGIPASLQAFATAPFTWTIDNGSLHHAHSMLTSIRYSDRSVPDSDLTAVTKYPTELIKREHQDLPVTYQGNLSFSKVGTVYLRAYAEIQGEDHWSPEVRLDVTPVPPTGTVVDVVHGEGDFLGGISPTELSLALGDAIRLVNHDVVERTLTFTSGPVAVPTLAAGELGGASDPVVLDVPGLYEFTTNDLQPQTLRVTVAQA